MKPDWIAVDWGTSNLRVWAMDAEGNVLANAGSDKGMGSLAPDEFEPTLLSLIEPWLNGPTTIIACGMIGAKQGWSEAPYLQTPCPPHNATKIITAPARDPRLSVQILPGISQTKPADVMRGEETQIAGLIAENPQFDGVVCLPGTHTKWVRISAEEVVNFTTFMTGEIFALLAEKSVLHHSIGEGWKQDAFDQALSDTISRPESFAAKTLCSSRRNVTCRSITERCPCASFRAAYWSGTCRNPSILAGSKCCNCWHRKPRQNLSIRLANPRVAANAT